MYSFVITSQWKVNKRVIEKTEMVTMCCWGENLLNSHCRIYRAKYISNKEILLPVVTFNKIPLYSTLHLIAVQTVDLQQQKKPSSWAWTNNKLMNVVGEVTSQILNYVHSINMSWDTVFEQDIRYLKCINASCICFLDFYTGRIKKDLEATGVTAVELWWGLSQDHLSENHRQHFTAHISQWEWFDLKVLAWIFQVKRMVSNIVQMWEVCLWDSRIFHLFIWCRQTEPGWFVRLQSKVQVFKTVIPGFRSSSACVWPWPLHLIALCFSVLI